MWLVQYSGMRPDNTDTVMNILKAKRIPFVPVGIRPFTTEIIGIEEADLSGRVLAYGSCKLVNLVKELGLSPGVFFDHSTFNAMAWKNCLVGNMVNHPHFITVKTLRRLDTYRPDAATREIFVRPVMDLKLFSGGVKPAGVSWNAFLDERLNGSTLNENTLLAVSKVQPIDGEWRCFIVNRKFVTGSQYRINGELKPDPTLPEGLQDFVDTVALSWLPHDHCVMDVAMVDGEFKVVEFNCINASGLYKADAEKLVDTLNALLVE